MNTRIVPCFETTTFETHDILESVYNVVKRLSTLEILDLQEACNGRRLQLLEEGRRSSDDFVCGFPRSLAIQEATPEFLLWEPTTVTLALSEQEYSAPQATLVDLVTHESRLTTYARYVQRSNGRYGFIDPATGKPLKVTCRNQLSTNCYMLVATCRRE